jgi:hypothetical protein
LLLLQLVIKEIITIIMTVYCQPRCERPSERRCSSSGCNGEDGVREKKVAVNVLNKQQRTSDKGCPRFWWLGDLLTTPYQVTALLNIAQSLELGLILRNGVRSGNWKDLASGRDKRGEGGE